MTEGFILIKEVSQWDSGIPFLSRLVLTNFSLFLLIFSSYFCLVISHHFDDSVFNEGRHHLSIFQLMRDYLHLVKFNHNFLYVVCDFFFNFVESIACLMNCKFFHITKEPIRRIIFDQLSASFLMQNHQQPCYYRCYWDSYICCEIYCQDCEDKLNMIMETFWYLDETIRRHTIFQENHGRLEFSVWLNYGPV